MVHQIKMGMTVCEIVESNQCIEYQEHESLYCCQYFSEYQDIYLYLVRIVVYTDMTDLILSSLAIIIAVILSLCKIAKESGIYIMAFSSFVTSIATFIMIALVTVNDMLDTAQHIYDMGCYNRASLELIVELKNEMVSIIWVDSLNGGIDIIALSILFYGICFQDRRDNQFNTSKAILVYIVLYVLRLTVSYITYFHTELPAYRHFITVQSNPDALCYRTFHVPYEKHHPFGSQTVL